MKFSLALIRLLLAAHAAALSIGGKQMHVERDSDGLQNIVSNCADLFEVSSNSTLVTYDQHSLMVYGERLLVFSGEFHPYRLPVPDLWLDVFQKIKALGFNAVSFYVHWALLEGQPGVYTAEGIFAFEPFFDAAQQAGIYLIARPGPVGLILVIWFLSLTGWQYINAESSGGGFPGWVQRVVRLISNFFILYAVSRSYREKRASHSSREGHEILCVGDRYTKVLI